MDPYSAEIILKLSSTSRPLWRRTHQSYIARQRVVTKRLRRAHLPRWKLPRRALDYSIWIDSRWQDVEKGRHAVFLTAVNRMKSDHFRERDYDLTKPRIAVYKNNWKIQQNALSWCNLRIAQSRGLQFYQTRTNAIILYNTLLGMCIEKVVIRKPAEELYNKSYQSSIAPQRMKPNLNYERQDTTCSDARTSFDHSDKHVGTYKETCRGGIDFRIQGLHHSAVQEHDHILKESSSEIDSPVRESPEQRSTTSTLKTQNRAFNPFSEQ